MIGQINKGVMIVHVFKLKKDSYVANFGKRQNKSEFPIGLHVYSLIDANLVDV